MSAESVLEQLSREVVAGERLSFVVRGVGAEAILALIDRARAAEERAAAATAKAFRAGDLVRVVNCEGSPDQGREFVVHGVKGESVYESPHHSWTPYTLEPMRSATKAANWQPIETAPMNERILVLVDGLHVVAVRGMLGVYDDDDRRIPATHWRPLPDPPQNRAITRAAFSSDPATAIRAADAGPVTVVGEDGETRMVLSTMDGDDWPGYGR